jgi:hypothetical protein
MRLMNAKNFLAALLLAACAGWPTMASARLPAAFDAVVVTPSDAGGDRRFDLRPAIAAAARSGKPMLLYFGAHDCPPCRVLERSLTEHSARLAPKMAARYQMVDIQGYLRGPRKLFVLPDGDYTLEQFRERVGDGKARFVWPSWFMLNGSLKMIRWLPPGNSDYLDPDWFEEQFGL